MSKTPFPPIDGAAASTVRRWRSATLGLLGPVHELSAMPWPILKEFPIFPGATLGSPLIQVPSGWLPGNGFQRSAMRNIDPGMRGRLTSMFGPRHVEFDETVRRALLALWLLRVTVEGDVRTYVPSSWITMSRWLLRVAVWAAENAPARCDTLFAHLTPSHIQAMEQTFAGDGELKAPHFKNLIHCLMDARARGILNDAPSMHEAPSKPALRSEKGREGVTLPEVTRIKKKEVWQPFEEAFVSELIGRALWLQRNLADQIIDCWARCRNARDTAVEAGHSPGNPKWVMAPQRAEIARTEWVDAAGVEVTRDVIVAKLGPEAGESWPPRGMRGLNRWIEIIQGLNIHMLAFCIGARKNEIGSATGSSLRFENGEAYFRGRTSKTTASAEGELRDWPLHPAGVTALRVQAALAERARQAGGDHLWVTAVAPREGTDGRNHELWMPSVASVKYLGLASLAGGSVSLDERLRPERRRKRQDGGVAQVFQHAHPHRWRHTVARLVALTMVEAPQVLFDLFGHRDLAMTLHYMTSHPKIREDAERIAREAALIIAEDAIEDVMEGVSSGPATEKIRAALVAMDVDDAYERGDDVDPGASSNMVKGEEKLGVSSLREAARKLTLAKRAWILASPGVLCTKAADEIGPCSQGGAPDVGGCRTSCGHRLERRAAEGQCRSVLSELFEMHGQAEMEGRVMLLANIEGQIRANLSRWDGVREEFLKDNEVARRLWGEAAA